MIQRSGKRAAPQPPKMTTQTGRPTNGDCREDNDCVLNEMDNSSEVSGRIDTDRVPRKRRAPEPPKTPSSPGGDTKYSGDGKDIAPIAAESKPSHTDVELDVSENRTIELAFFEKKIVSPLSSMDYPKHMNPFGEEDDVIEAHGNAVDVDIIDVDVDKHVKAIGHTDFNGKKGARGRSIDDYPEELNPFACDADDDNSADTGVEE